MKTVKVNLAARSYELRIGRGLITCADEILAWIDGREICIISDANVAELYLDKFCKTLKDKKVITHIIPPGEEQKTLQVANDIFTLLLQNACARDTTIIALGGGVVGDLAGFVAACYLRGVGFIQIPTTLLAQVDSSVGGKTAVNHPLGKNMIGAFYQPRRVLIDLDTLATLDARQFAAGLAEVIKYGIIADQEFFVWLEKNLNRVLVREQDALEFIVQRSCINKSKIVVADERESGARALLNLGHTFAHALETGLGYGTLLHGEAVATGMVMAAHLSAKLGWLSADEFERVKNILDAAGLPTGKFSGLNPPRMLELMQVDKKVRAGELRLILLNKIGDAKITTDYPQAELVKTIGEFID